MPAIRRPSQSGPPSYESLYPDPTLNVQPVSSEKISTVAVFHTLKSNDPVIKGIEVKKGFFSKMRDKISSVYKNLRGAHLDSSKAKAKIAAAMAAEKHKLATTTPEDRKKDYDLALKNFKEAKQYSVSKWEIDLGIAQQHYEEKEYKQALTHLNLIPTSKFNLEMIYFKAVVLKDTGDYLAAHRLYELLISGKRLPEKIERTDLKKELVELVENWAAKPEKSLEELEVLVDYYPANKEMWAQACIKDALTHFFIKKEKGKEGSLFCDDKRISLYKSASKLVSNEWQALAYIKEGEKHYYSDVKKAYAFFKKAGYLGDEWAERCFMQGLIKDPYEAHEWYDRGTELGRLGSHQAYCSSYLDRIDDYHPNRGYCLVQLAFRLMRVKDPKFQFSDNLRDKDRQIDDAITSYRQSQKEKTKKIKSEIEADLAALNPPQPPFNVDIEKRDYFKLDEIQAHTKDETNNLETITIGRKISKPSEKWKWDLTLARHYEKLANTKEYELHGYHGKALEALLLIPSSKFSPELHYVKANLLWKVGKLEEASKEYDLVRSQVKINSPLARRMVPEQDLLTKQIVEQDQIFATQKQKVQAEQITLIKELEEEFGIKIIGKEQWENIGKVGENLGDVGEVPLLPLNIREILQSPCPFWPGKIVAKTQVLCLIPATVNGKRLGSEELKKLMMNPKQGSRLNFIKYPKIRGEVPNEESHWGLMTMDVLPESLSKDYTTQKNLVEREPGYDVPYVVQAAACMSMTYMTTGKYPSANYTRCQDDDINGEFPIVGGFQDREGSLPGHFRIFNSVAKVHKNVGIVAVRRLF